MRTPDTYTNQEFYHKMYEDSDISKEDLVILTCAIFIASIGLNMNSQATIIGAMLISPLMSPILAIGTALAIYDQELLKRAVKTLGIEVLLSVLVASIYFYFSPISYASQEIINRTAPTLWDALIALFGGTAGIIGARKKTINNIVPGVAIATALMPPICTVGYGIASKNLSYATGAGYLFIINAFFIILTTYAGVKALRMPSRQKVEAEPRLTKHKRIFYIGLTALILLPSVISAKSLVQKSILDASVKNFATEELTHATIIKQSIDEKDKILRFTIAGNDYTDAHIDQLQNDLKHYGLSGYELKITQIAELSQLSGKQFEAYISSIIESHQNANTQAENSEETSDYAKINATIHKMDETVITDVASATGYLNDEEIELVVIQTKNDITKNYQEKLTKQIQKKYPQIAKVYYVSKKTE